MKQIDYMLDHVKTVVLLGHTHPDGDCIGSCLGLYNYLMEWWPNLTVDLFLDQAPSKFSYMKYFDKILFEKNDVNHYDLCICLDSGDRERLGDFVILFDQAADSICLDHHITNNGYAKTNIVVDHASSTCEVLYDLLDPDKISKETAECLYTGIIHDTGVFKYSNTSARTMEIAGKLMAKGIDFSTIIDDSFYKRSYIQNQILGRALLESVLVLKGRAIFSAIKSKDMDFYQVSNQDLDGIVENLRNTDGVECAIFLYEIGVHEYKVSLRSNQYIDVSQIAGYFGGGGHIRAAGCSMTGNIYDVVNNITAQIDQQLRQQETADV